MPHSEQRPYDTNTKLEAAQQKAQGSCRPQGNFQLHYKAQQLKEPWVIFELNKAGSQEVTRVGQVLFPRLA